MNKRIKKKRDRHEDHRRLSRLTYWVRRFDLSRPVNWYADANGICTIVCELYGRTVVVNDISPRRLCLRANAFLEGRCNP